MKRLVLSGLSALFVASSASAAVTVTVGRRLSMPFVIVAKSDWAAGETDRMSPPARDWAKLVAASFADGPPQEQPDRHETTMVVATSALDGEPDVILKMAEDSLSPVALALGTTAFFAELDRSGSPGRFDRSKS